VDYLAFDFTAAIADGVTSHQVSVNVCDDALIEGEETFFANLSEPTNATIADGQGEGTILDDDPAPTATSTATATATASATSTATATPTNTPSGPPSVSISDVEVAEDAGGPCTDTCATFTLTLSHATNQNVVVSLQTDNGTQGTADPGSFCNVAGEAEDYFPFFGSVTIPAGSTQTAVSVNVCNDTVQEVTENFFLNITNATNATVADSQGEATILDDDLAF
jgi:serralysin